MPALILAIIKAAPSLERLFSDVVALWSAWKLQQNADDENAKNARNAAAVDAALRELPKLCPSCPFARNGTGQHGAADSTSAVQGGGPGGA